MPCLSTRGYSHQSSPNRKVHTIIIYCSQISRGCTFLSWDDYHLVIANFQLITGKAPPRQPRRWFWAFCCGPWWAQASPSRTLTLRWKGRWNLERVVQKHVGQLPCGKLYKITTEIMKHPPCLSRKFIHKWQIVHIYGLPQGNT